jgi:uncharacterized membrane protein YphA (DoxX/SURF4 family)
MQCCPEASDHQPVATIEHKPKMTRAANREVITMKNQTNDQRLSKAKNAALWALQILTAAAFLMAGFAKLSGQPMMVETFDKVGIGQWFRYVTGGIEVASAILLLIRRLTPVGAALLVCTMIGVRQTNRSPSRSAARFIRANGASASTRPVALIKSRATMTATKDAAFRP